MTLNSVTPNRPDGNSLLPWVAPLPVETSVGIYCINNYPPLSCWKPEYIPKFLHALSQPPKLEPIGLQVNLPFCRQHCLYCYSHTYPNRSQDDIQLYIDSLVRELACYQRYPAVQGRLFNSVYVGGGSPSFLSLDQLRRLFHGLQNVSPWDNVEECTCECEPGTVTPEKLRALRELGVTRISLGFQTLNNPILRRSGRDVKVQDCFRAFLQAREAGFDEINVDLIAGLEGETLDTWRATIDRILELEPDCVTIYQFELRQSAPLYHSMETGRHAVLPTWPEKRELVGNAFATLERAGYTISGTQTAVRHPGQWRSIHTIENFWHGADVIAIGEGAVGLMRGVLYQNAESFESCTNAAERGRLPLHRAFRLRPDQRLRREVILLLKTGQLDASYLRKKYKIDLLDYFENQFQGLICKGLLVVDGDEIRLTKEGLLEIDWLLPTFYSPEHCGHPDTD